MITVNFLLLFLTFLVNWFYSKDFKYPPTLFSLMWSALYFLLIFTRGNFYEISITTNLIVLCGVVSFSVGSYIIKIIFQRKNIHSNNAGQIQFNLNTSKYLILIGLFLLGTFLILIKGIYLGLNGSSGNFFMNIRIAQAGYEGSKGYGSIGYFLWINYFIMTLALIIMHSTRKFIKTAYLISLLTLISSIFFTGRGFLLLWLVILLCVGVLYNKVNKKKLLFWMILFVTTIFPLYALILNKGLDLHLSFKENLIKLGDLYSTYLLSALPALSIEAQGKLNFEFPLNIFAKFIPYLNSLGLELDQSSIIKEFVYVPKPTNIYTGFEPYYMDLGYFGVFVFFLIFGLVHGYFYFKIIISKKNAIHVIWFVLLFYPLTMNFMGDFFFSTINIWVIFILLSTFIKVRIPQRYKKE
jgi:oligosaccharide repeat unit polymerase